MNAWSMFNFRGLESMSMAEFSESLYSYIGNRFYDRDQSYLIFKRYDADMDGRISYREWCRFITPSDRVLASLLLGRTPPANSRLSQDTQEVFKRLIRAHLNLEQAQEYLRQRAARTRGQNSWTMQEVFEALDMERKGSITVYDLERLIIEQKRGGSRSLVDEIELLINMYDRTGFHKICYIDFQNELIPHLQS
uniref:EF-hand domain-containing protein n=1 Tax=Favella ehrenbergii TaxID=182087 RepID=A0A7S3MHN6_9SPIT|mmetsp:Transcript_10806/g.13574  ORF Transcript_10806/g.13574 Transcript_10806/m.13574 type:complete len:194 (+) Transcript_10806:2238-2819(+)